MAETPCASVARERQEPLHATASIVRNWVLLEQPGPWGRDAPGQSRLRRDVALELQARARTFGFRFLLLRQPNPSGDSRRRCFVASSRRSGRWIEQLVLDDASELLNVDFSPLAHGRSLGKGTPRHDPLFLVCTNGKHDPCCARLGRPIARALVPDSRDSVWECSHIGGDRFAGNLVCLPHGFYFGNLGPDEAARVVEGYQRGILELSHYRGTAGDPYVVQAAEYFLRRDQGLPGVDDVVPVGYRKAGPGVVVVDLRAPAGRRFRVTVKVGPAPDARPLTCASEIERHPPTFSLLELQLT